MRLFTEIIDLYCAIPVTVSQAALGTDLFVTTLDGRKIKVKIGEFIDFSSLDFGEGKPDYASASRQVFEEICKLSTGENE